MSECYAPVIIPANKIHLSIGVSPAPGAVVVLHGIPAQFPLAMAYIEVLTSLHTFGFEYKCPDNMDQSEFGSSSGYTDPELSKSCDSDSLSSSITITPPVLRQVAEILGIYLCRTDIAPTIKECVFHTLAQTLRVLYSSETSSHVQVKRPAPSPQLYLQLQTELYKLYDVEMKTAMSASPSDSKGSPGSPVETRFSSYFQALLELVLASYETTTSNIPTLLKPLSKEAEQPKLNDPVFVGATPTGSTGMTRLKKTKTKRSFGSVGSGYTPPGMGASSLRRLRRVSSTSSGTNTATSGNSSPNAGTSQAKSPLQPKTNALEQSSLTKHSEMMWFHRALTMSRLLRCLLNDSSSDPVDVLRNTVIDSLLTISVHTAHSRVLVITGINIGHDPEKIRKTLLKVCNTHGGLYKDKLYLPTQKVCRFYIVLL